MYEVNTLLVVGLLAISLLREQKALPRMRERRQREEEGMGKGGGGGRVVVSIPDDVALRQSEEPPEQETIQGPSDGSPGHKKSKKSHDFSVRSWRKGVQQ